MGTSNRSARAPWWAVLLVGLMLSVGCDGSAEPDASAPGMDGGAHDAGDPDGGADAGSLDADPDELDAATPTVDAGTRDAEAGDAGVIGCVTATFDTSRFNESCFGE